jgi:stage V sporulation protein SpoVS
MARYLKNISKQGIYNPETKRLMLQNVGTAFGQQAANAKATARGYLANMGMENSIAGASAIAEPELKTAEALANASRGIDLENANSKTQAKMQYAMGKDQNAGVRRAESTQATQSLLGGLSGVAGAGYGMWKQGEEEKQVNSILGQITDKMSLGTEEGDRMAEALIMSLIGKMGYMGGQ